jgi:purine catabolism regulator
MDNVKSLQEIINRAKVYDWDFEKGNVVAIFDIDNFKGQYLNLNKENRIELEIVKENIFSYIRKIIKNKFKDAVYTNFSDSIIFILKPFENDLDNFKAKFNQVSTMIKREILQKYKFSITIGVGSYKLSPTDINISYNQAKKSIQIARNIYRKNATMFYEDLGIYKLFDKLSSETEKIDFYKSYIGKLLEYDEENNTNFLNTLKCLYENDWNLKVTAKQMYIHYNTMKYRFNKIMEILKLDLKNSEDKLNVSVALKLLDMAK